MRHALFLFLAFFIVMPASADPITYQGQLRQSGQPSTGTPDMTFRLYDSLVGGAQVGPDETFPQVPVSEGLFQVELDFGLGAFDGSARYLEIVVDGTTLSPRQRVTAAPTAEIAFGVAPGTIGSAEIDAAEVQARVASSCPAGSYIQAVNQDGTVICGTDADTGGTVTSIATGTGLTGGPITTTGTISIADNAIGTGQIDPAQVQQRVTGSCPGGQYVQSISETGTVVCGAEEPSWRLGGNAGTSSATNFLGTTDDQALELRTANVRSLRIEPSAELFEGLPITANVIAGSHANEVSPGVSGATIAGGGVPAGSSFYTALGPNRVEFAFGTVGGGLNNQAGRDVAGEDNTFATVSGGLSNTASNFSSTVSGGVGNIARGTASAVGGGDSNQASDFYSTVGGGDSNQASGGSSTVGGGTRNIASGTASAVGGGDSNRASGNTSTVSGGFFNTASGYSSFVGGGLGNCAGGSYSWAGGRRAKVRPATDPGGFGPCSGLTYPGGGDTGSFVWADSTNEDFVSTRANQFRIRTTGGAEFQTGSHGLVAFSDSTSTTGAAIQGESVNAGGIAIVGRNNSTDATLVLNNRGTGRLIRAFTGGTVLMNLENSGNLWIAGTLTQSSDRNQKEDIQSVDAQMVLDRLSALPINSWRYLRSDEGVRHIGPMAQDFHAAFGFGVSDTTISTVDAQGIAFAAIQALNQRLVDSNAELHAEVAVLKAQSGQMRELADRNAQLEQRLVALEALLLGGGSALAEAGR